MYDFVTHDNAAWTEWTWYFFTY